MSLSTLRPTRYQQPTSAPPLENRAIHIYITQLDFPTTLYRALATLLTDVEQKSICRFTTAQLRNRAIASRAFTRWVLSCYARISPQKLNFSYGINGKPNLANNEIQSISFNLSHSQAVAVIALALNRELGVDIECLCKLPDQLSLANIFFAPDEAKRLSNLPKSEQTRAFYRVWTCKEAYLKAIGTGIGCDHLSRCEFSSDPDQLPQLLKVDKTQSLAEKWSIYPLEPAHGYLGALAIPGIGWRTKFWKLDLAQAIIA